MASVQMQRTFYTDSSLTSSNPTVSEGVIIDIKTITVPSNTTSKTDYTTKTGDGSTSYTGLAFDTEVFLQVSGNVTLGTAFIDKQIFTLYSLTTASSVYTIDLGASAIHRYIYLNIQSLC